MSVFKFIPPQEAPVFEPTPEEFRDPLSFILKLTPIVEKTGICKIKPPRSWQPPFCGDVHQRKFVPRCQRLRELDGKNRVKLIFLDRLAKFHELQGSILRVPTVDRKYVDLYELYSAVQHFGGFETVSKERTWSKIVQRVYGSKGIQTSTLKHHYQRLLYPYELFERGESLKATNVNNSSVKTDNVAVKRDPESNSKVRRSARQKSHDYVPDLDEISSNPELRRLQFFGAGPKMNGVSINVPQEKYSKRVKIPLRIKSEPLELEVADFTPETQNKAVVPELLPPHIRNQLQTIDTYVCRTCSKGDDEEFLLLCDSCVDCYHTFCLIPPIPKIPQGDWRCPLCINKQCKKPSMAFGFEQSKLEYSLQSFGEKADTFKQDYFNCPPNMVPCDVVEREYWRLVGSIEEDVVVEYGADLHTMDYGSGFPTKSSIKHIVPEDEHYVSSPWNLNNLSVLDRSVLKYIDGDMSGMKVPWMYVGMCFSTFCWHTEDHWSYSINYLHWGEPKTWYGAPPREAEALEAVFNKETPELFNSQPDLMHHLVTTMNPMTLLKNNVSIYRTDQHAGEFIVTLPRAYHAGFNQGYNIAEAVNFCPAQWLSIGRQCVDHYRRYRRYCVFSHDELLCKLVRENDIEFELIIATYNELVHMYERETLLRSELCSSGTVTSEEFKFEEFDDDLRQCICCKTTLFLSGVFCECNPVKMACLYHHLELCDCLPSKRIMRYRYTLKQLQKMVVNMKNRTSKFSEWSSLANGSLKPGSYANKKSIDEFKELLQEGGSSFQLAPSDATLCLLKKAIDNAEKCIMVSKQIFIRRHKTRIRVQQTAPVGGPQLTFAELKGFLCHLQSIPVKLEEEYQVEELVNKIEKFKADTKNAVINANPDIAMLEELLNFGLEIDVEIEELSVLRTHLEQVKWLHEVKNVIQDEPPVKLEKLQILIDSGSALIYSPNIDQTVEELRNMHEIGKQLEDKAKDCINIRPKRTMEYIEKVIDDASGVDAHIYLPAVNNLIDIVSKAKDWLVKVDEIGKSEEVPYYETVEVLVNKGKQIQVHLDVLTNLESRLACAREWKDTALKHFAIKATRSSLDEILAPRSTFLLNALAARRKRRGKDEVDGHVFVGHDTDIELALKYEGGVFKEVEAMKDFRNKNLLKRVSVGSEDIFCHCKRKTEGFMVQCDLCKDWFHAACVTLPKSVILKAKTGTGQTLVSLMEECEFVCPVCCKTKRPKLDVVLMLLLSYKQLSVKLHEGDALQCQIERVIQWREQVKTVFNDKDVAVVNSCIFGSKIGIDLDEIDQKSDNPALHLKAASSDQDMYLSSEHTYSTVSRFGVPPLPKKTKKPSYSARSACPVLSSDMLTNIDDLLLEGHLFEISVYETYVLCKILRTACGFYTTNCYLDPSKYNAPASILTNFERVERKRRRRVEPGETENFVGGEKKICKDKLEEDEEWSSCASRECIKPSGDGIDWVACDRCEKWFHFVCIGLATTLAEDDEYICEYCTQFEEDISKNFKSGLQSDLKKFDVSESIVDVISIPKLEFSHKQPTEILDCSSTEKQFDSAVELDTTCVDHTLCRTESGEKFINFVLDSVERKLTTIQAKENISKDCVKDPVLSDKAKNCSEDNTNVIPSNEVQIMVIDGCISIVTSKAS